MIMIIVLALPVAMGLVLLPLRRLRFLVVPLATAAALVTGVSLLTPAEIEPLVVMGRVLALSPRQQLSLAFCSFVLAVTMLFTHRIPQEPAAYSLALGALAVFIAATAARSMTLAALLLQLGMILSAMMLASAHPGAPMSGMRALVLFVLAGLFILLGSWALERAMMQPEQEGLGQIGQIALVLGLGLALGVAPLGSWLPSTFRSGNPLGTVVCSVLLSAAVLLRLDSIAQIISLDVHFINPAMLLVVAGLATGILANLGALLQRTMTGVLGYAAIADLGLVLIGLGLGQASVGLALLHFALRGIAIVVVSMAVGVLQLCFGNDDIGQLAGSFRLAPWAVIGVLVGGFSLVGLPPTAGLTTRLSLYKVLSGAFATWTVILMISSLAPAWSLVRFALAAISPHIPSGRQEPLWYRLLTLPLLLIILSIGLMPQLLNLLPQEWLQLLFGGVLGPGV